MKNNKTFRFRDFPVYKDSLAFLWELKAFTKKKFPKSEMYALTSQLWRALDSVVLNIAEGTDKYSKTEFSHFLNHSIGSINEVVACLDIALQEEYLSKSEHSKYLDKADNLYRQLKAFSAHIRKSS